MCNFEQLGVNNCKGKYPTYSCRKLHSSVHLCTVRRLLCRRTRWQGSWKGWMLTMTWLCWMETALLRLIRRPDDSHSDQISLEYFEARDAAHSSMSCGYQRGRYTSSLLTYLPIELYFTGRVSVNDTAEDLVHKAFSVNAYSDVHKHGSTSKGSARRYLCAIHCPSTAYISIVTQEHKALHRTPDSPQTHSHVNNLQCSPSHYLHHVQNQAFTVEDAAVSFTPHLLHHASPRNPQVCM
jgi:hypothetical protein